MLNLVYNARVAAASALDMPFLLPKSIHPTLANLLLTENCNAKCITCDYWRTSERPSITKERAIRLLGELRDIGVRKLRLTGGEVLLRQDLFEILDTCGKDWFDSVTLATNGLLLPRYAERINESVITRVSVSLDAIGQRNDRIRGCEGYYETVVNALPSINKEIKVASTFTKELLFDLEELILFCREHGYGFDVNLLDAQPFFSSSQQVIETVDSLRPNEDQVECGIEILARYKVLPEYILANARQFMIDRTFRYNHCVLGYVSVNVKANGDVTTGCIVFKPVGNVLESDLATIVDSTGYRESAVRMYHMHCPLCACGYSFSATYKEPGRTLPYILHRVR